MDIKAYIKKMEDFQKQGVANYKFATTEDIVLIIAGLRGLQQYDTAIELYQKYEDTLKSDDIYPVALTNIIEVCNEHKNIPLLIQYTRELREIYPDHTHVIEIAKYHAL